MTLKQWLSVEDNKISVGDVIQFTDGSKIVVGDLSIDEIFSEKASAFKSEIVSIDNLDDLYV